MPSRQFAPSSYLRLKATFGYLLELNGGGSDAARFTRVKQQRLSRCASRNPDDQDEFATADVIADLEHACGEAPITALLAELAGCLLIPMPKGEPGDQLAAEAGQSAEAFGQMMVDFGTAVRDGVITAEEGSILIAAVHRVMVALARFAETVKIRTEGDPQ